MSLIYEHPLYKLGPLLYWLVLTFEIIIGIRYYEMPQKVNLIIKYYLILIPRLEFCQFFHMKMQYQMTHFCSYESFFKNFFPKIHNCWFDSTVTLEGIILLFTYIYFRIICIFLLSRLSYKWQVKHETYE